MDYASQLRSPIENSDVNALLSVLKDANDAEEDLAAIVKGSEKEVAGLLFEGLKEEETHDHSAIFLSRICAGNKDCLLAVCELLKDKETRLAAGSAAVLSNVCARSPATCAKLPSWVVDSLVSIVKKKPEKEAFVDRRRWSRVRAVEALGAIGDAKAIPALVAAMGDSDPMIVLRARYALADMDGTKKVFTELLALLQNEKRVVPVVGALWVLEKIALRMPEEEAADLMLLIPVLANLLATSGDAEVQLRSARAIVNLDREKGIAEIAGLLGKDFGPRNEKVWRTAVDSLARLAETGYPAARNALKAFVAREEKLPEGKRSPVYREAKFSVDVLEAGDEKE